MNRFTAFSVFIIVMIAFCETCFSSQKDFRNTRWGMTKIEVMASEEKKPESFAGPSLSYRTMMLGKEMYLIYEFVDNKLIDAIYVFIARNEQDYQEIERILTKKYGEAVTGRNDGPVDYFYKWETSLTEIVLKPGAGKDCRIEYQSKKLKKYREKIETRMAVEREKKVLDFF